MPGTCAVTCTTHIWGEARNIAYGACARQLRSVIIIACGTCARQLRCVIIIIASIAIDITSYPSLQVSERLQGCRRVDGSSHCLRQHRLYI